MIVVLLVLIVPISATPLLHPTIIDCLTIIMVSYLEPMITNMVVSLNNRNNRTTTVPSCTQALAATRQERLLDEHFEVTRRISTLEQDLETLVREARDDSFLTILPGRWDDMNSLVDGHGACTLLHQFWSTKCPQSVQAAVTAWLQDRASHEEEGNTAGTARREEAGMHEQAQDSESSQSHTVSGVLVGVPSLEELSSDKESQMSDSESLCSDFSDDLSQDMHAPTEDNITGTQIREKLDDQLQKYPDHPIVEDFWSLTSVLKDMYHHFSALSRGEVGWDTRASVMSSAAYISTTQLGCQGSAQDLLELLNAQHRQDDSLEATRTALQFMSDGRSFPHS